MSSLSQRILQELGKWVMLTTPQLIQRCAAGMKNARKRVWSVLKWLERAGLVASLGRRPHGPHPRPTRWTLAT